MEPSTPFVDRESGKFDVEQILEEAVPVAKLLGLFFAVALAPLVFAVFVGGPLGGLMMLIAQFVLAIGSALTLMYVVVRAIQLSREQVPPAGTARRASDGAAADDASAAGAGEDAGAAEEEDAGTGPADEDDDADGSSGGDGEDGDTEADGAVDGDGEDGDGEA